MLIWTVGRGDKRKVKSFGFGTSVSCPRYSHEVIQMRSRSAAKIASER